MYFIVLLLVIALPIIVVIRVNCEAFSAAPLLNKSEARLYRLVQSHLPSGLYLAPQVAYGEFLKSRSLATYRTMNCRRADLVIYNRFFNVVEVLEYQGTGHYGSTQKTRRNARRSDRMKRKALKSAGILLCEIPAQFTSNDIVRELKKIP